METLTKKAKIDNLAMTSLKLEEIRHVIAHTDKGDLCLMLRKGGSGRDYKFVLDAVPVEEEKNKELMSLFNGVLFTI